jgi:peptidyl-prolyl cis-trans isomerase D
MGAMSKMRNSTPIVLWVLIFSFGILWVLQDTQVFDAMAGGPTHLGSVNGDNISHEEFNSRVSFYVDQHNEQRSTPMTSEMRAFYEEQAWEDLIAERLMAQKMEKLGIKVTDQELVNMITGDNPDPFIRQQFADEDGRIDRIALQAAIEAPENQQIWMMIEQQLRQNRSQQKMSNFITSGLRVSSNDIDRAYKKQNSFADIRFIRFPFSEISDDEIEVTDREIRDYYDRNKNQFHREESYRFQYVAFDKTPTREDTLRITQDVEELRERFAEAEDHAEFLRQYESVTEYRDRFVHRDEIRDEYKPVLDLEVGEVSEVHMINGNPHMFKLVDQRDDEIKFAVFSYDVIADPIATIDRLAEEAEEFSFFASEDGFEAEAETQGYEIRTGSATKGTSVVPGIGEARPLVNELERMRRGHISDGIELADKFVVVKMTEVISAGPRPLSEVRSQIENNLREMKRKETAVQNARELARGIGSLEELAEVSGKEIQSANNLRMGSNSISGAGREPGIIGAVFGLEKGAKSGVLEGNNAAFVIEVVDLDVADPAAMSSDERRNIRQQLEQQKYIVFSEVWLDQMKKDANIRDNRHRLMSR